MKKVAVLLAEGFETIEALTSVDILRLKVKVKFGETREDEYYETYDAKDVKWDRN